MKKIILALMAATVVASTPAMAAPHQGRDDRANYSHVERSRTVTRHVVVRDDHRGRQQAAHQWRKGERFDSHRSRDYRVIASPTRYRLHDAPRGYRWVQSGHDAVLIGIASGIVAAVMANAIG
jgi:Ni/Co efflux regulator RcnB